MPTKIRSQREAARKGLPEKHIEDGWARRITRKDGTRYFACPLHRSRKDALDWMKGQNQRLMPGWKGKVVPVRIIEI